MTLEEIGLHRSHAARAFLRARAYADQIASVLRPGVDEVLLVCRVDAMLFILRRSELTDDDLTLLDEPPRGAAFDARDTELHLAVNRALGERRIERSNARAVRYAEAAQFRPLAPRRSVVELAPAPTPTPSPPERPPDEGDVGGRPGG